MNEGRFWLIPLFEGARFGLGFRVEVPEILLGTLTVGSILPVEGFGRLRISKLVDLGPQPGQEPGWTFVEIETAGRVDD